MKRSLLILSCIFSYAAQAQIDPGTTVGSTGSVQFQYHGSLVTLTTVRAADNNIWLQQNLGSAQVATASNDANSYGDYFQFGRWDDGHQLPTSTVLAASTLAANNPSGLSDGSSNFYNGFWSSGTSADTWSGADVSATNGIDPCAAIGPGWHLPTAVELSNMKTAEGLDGNWDAATIPAAYFNSNLKFSRAGNRTGSGSFQYQSGVVMVWSSTVNSAGQPQAIVSGLGLNYVGNPGITRDAGASCRCLKLQSFTLPIELLDFKGYNNGGSNYLYWETANLLKTESMEVQRSANGNNFETIAVVGTDNGTIFHYNDNSPYEGVNLYRLRFTGSDNKETFSQVVNINTKVESKWRMQFYPNPVNQQLHVTIMGSIDSNASIRVYDIAGHVLKNIIVKDAFQNLDLTDLPAGGYILTYTDNSHSYTSRLTKH